MRTRELVALVVLAALAGACLNNPDPRSPSVKETEQRAYGGYIVITTEDHQLVAGELISIDGDVIRVLLLAGPSPRFVYVRTADIESAELFEYESQGGFGAWGLLGTLSTISHGFILALSAPVWIIATGVTVAAETRSVHLAYPADGWAEFLPWARFPQGMPPGLDEDALLRPRAQRAPRVPPPPPPPTMDQVREEAAKQAWSLTRQAAAAARGNDCSTVLAISGQVQTIDADFYDKVFLADPAIRGCLGLAPPPTAPPAQSP